MLGEKFALEYTEQFKDDITDVISYITFSLENPQAAESLRLKTEKEIIDRSYAPTSVKPYHTDVESGDVYYPIYVGNFIVFYVVHDRVMEMRRFLYAKRDLSIL